MLFRSERSDIFLQTKYTPYDGQDPNNVPYDKNAEFPDQVMQSYRKSLSNLKTNYLDSLVLHSPLNKIENTIEVHLGFTAHRVLVLNLKGQRCLFNNNHRNNITIYIRFGGHLNQSTRREGCVILASVTVTILRPCNRYFLRPQ